MSFEKKVFMRKYHKMSESENIKGFQMSVLIKNLKLIKNASKPAISVHGSNWKLLYLDILEGKKGSCET